MIDRLLTLFAPHLCYGCAKTGSILCVSCTYNIIDEAFGRCIWCLTPTMQNEQCHPCSKRLGVQAAWAVGARQDTLKVLINAYKYDSTREASEVLGRLIHEKAALLPPATVVTAVPTAAKHIRQRGFDHAELVARQFARSRSLPYQPLLGRTESVTQHELTRAERLAHARRAFGLKSAELPKTVLLIDDILTTGATLEACVLLLRGAGVEEIYVAIVARQLFSERP